MHPDRRSTIASGLLTLLALALPAAAAAMCNALPTTERAFASDLGAIDRPYASPGREVKLTIGGCEPEAAEAEAPKAVFSPLEVGPPNEIEIRFTPPEAPAVSVMVPAADIVSVVSTELVFRFPDTEALLGTLHTGPATIIVRSGGVKLAHIDKLGTRGADCAFAPHATFANFTALPPPNLFHCLSAGLCPTPGPTPYAPGQPTATPKPGCCQQVEDVERVRAAIDRAGNLLVPWDWRNVYPPGPGFDPVARVVLAGQSSLEAFPAPHPRSGEGIVIPNATYVSAHAASGSVLPPFLDVGPPSGAGPFPGSTLIGTVDSLDGVMRIARRVGDDPADEIFDLASRLEDGVGAIVITMPAAVEAGLIDLRSVQGSTRVTALEEVGRGPGTAGLLVYDNHTGGFARVSAAPGATRLPRRVAVSDELVAFYDVAREQSQQPDLTVLPLAALPAANFGPPLPVDAADLIDTDLFGSRGDARPPLIGDGIVGGYLGGERIPRVYDVLTGATEDGSPVGGGDLVEIATGVRNRRTPAHSVDFGGELAPLAPDVAGHVFAVGNRAVFAACEGPCRPPNGTPADVILTLIEDGRRRELVRNGGIPFVFTGTLIGLARYEDGRYGGPGARADLDGDGTFDGVFLAVYDLEADRLVVVEGPNGGPVPLPAELDVAAREHVIVLGLEEASAGPLNCDGDRTDRVLAFVNGRARTLVNTREPFVRGALSAGRSLLTMLQPEDVFGRRLGSGFLNVMRDSDGDEVLDPYDDCPLRANVDQTDRDRDGIGDVCDGDCSTVDCPSAPPAPTAAVRSCRRRLHQASSALLRAELQYVLRCRAAASCERSERLRARARRQARSFVAACDAAALRAIGTCAGSLDELFPSGRDGCFAEEVAAAVRAVATVAQGGSNEAAPVVCQDALRAGAAHYASRRHRVLARCRDRLAAGHRLVRADGTPIREPSSCVFEAKTVRRLAKVGRVARAAIARDCPVAIVRALGPCAGADTLDALATADGRGGCLLATGSQVVDRVVAAEIGSVTAGIAGLAVPCPSPPVPTATPVPRPHSISVRARLDGPDGRRADLDLGWTGILHDQQVLGGAGFDADLDCAGGGACRIHGAVAGTLFAAPAPISAGGTAMCITTRFAGDVTGSFDTTTGTLTAVLPLRSEAVFTTALSQPCPACLANDGEPDLGDEGICSGGTRSGARCRVGGLANPVYGMVAGTSADCPPTPEETLKTLVFTAEATTGASTIAIGPNSPVCAGDRLKQCPCSLCNDAAHTPCRTSADCPVHEGTPGICGPRVCVSGTNEGAYCTNVSACPGGRCRLQTDQFGDLSQPDSCGDPEPPDEGPLCQSEGGDRAGCVAGPSDQFCSDEPWRGCLSDENCTFGTCMARSRSCFPDPMVRVGAADPPAGGHARPTLAATFCVASTQVNINIAGGLPGPGALVLPVEVQFQP